MYSLRPAQQQTPIGPGDSPRDGGESRHRAQQAFHLMCQHAEDELSISAIAETLGVGLRSLQIAFAEHYGIPPRDMLTRLRLERARAALMAAPAGARVTAIALEAGFTHLSRFSQSYRLIYGELPVETLRRARGPAAAPRAQ